MPEDADPPVEADEPRQASSPPEGDAPDQPTANPATHDATEPGEDPGDRIMELEEQVLSLQDRIEQLEAELSQRTDQLARAQADFQNYRKRSKQETDEAKLDAQVELVRLLVDVLDDLERARGHADPEDKVAEGLEMVVRRIREGLSQRGVVRLAPEPGDNLHPQVHEALMTEHTDAVEPGHIVECLQVGYELEGRLVRPALVKTATAPAGDGSEKEEDA